MKPKQGEIEFWFEVPAKISFRFYPAKKNPSDYSELMNHIEIENVALPNRQRIESILEEYKDAINRECMEEVQD